MSKLKLTKKGYSLWLELDESIGHLIDQFELDRDDFIYSYVTTKTQVRDREINDNIWLLRVVDKFGDKLIPDPMQVGNPPDEVTFGAVDYNDVHEHLGAHVYVENLVGSDLLSEDLDEDLWAHFKNHIDGEVFKIQYFENNKYKLLEGLTHDQKVELISIAENSNPLEFIGAILVAFGIILKY